MCDRPFFNTRQDRRKRSSLVEQAIVVRGLFNSRVQNTGTQIQQRPRAATRHKRSDARPRDGPPAQLPDSDTQTRAFSILEAQGLRSWGAQPGATTQNNIGTAKQRPSASFFAFRHVT